MKRWVLGTGLGAETTLIGLILVDDRNPALYIYTFIHMYNIYIYVYTYICMFSILPDFVDCLYIGSR